MLDALLWGGVAASSLLIGALLAIVRRWPDVVVGVVLAFGAGALMASVAFELAEGGLRDGGPLAVGVGLAAGALVYFFADRGVERWSGRKGASAAGAPLAIGALLDGIPEQAVLGIGLAAGGGVSMALLVSVFVSNLPEAIGSSSDMLAAGRSRRFVLSLWLVVVIVSVLAAVAGALIADAAPPGLAGIVDGFAAGALLVMLVDAMIPEARAKAKNVAGLATVVGFAVAASLSLLV
ncbi:ZIP family metal transporter [Agrococcus sp. Ld7]|uniref:ZIP family metal transporter n=1 Tax=Agrococcus sp. Ld7 TaxID=649148 RepID=UPI00386ABA47